MRRRRGRRPVWGLDVRRLQLHHFARRKMRDWRPKARFKMVQKVRLRRYHARSERNNSRNLSRISYTHIQMWHVPHSNRKTMEVTDKGSI